MELKFRTLFQMRSLSCTFNRTAYGIEIFKALSNAPTCLSF